MIDGRHRIWAENTEKALLSCLFQRGEDTFSEIVPNLTPEHFADSRHREIFQVFKRIGRSTDIAEIGDHVNPVLEECGGIDYVLHVADYAPTINRIPEMIETLNDHKTRRDVVNLASEMTRRAFDSEKPIQDTIYDIAGQISAITDENGPSGIVTGQQAAQMELDRVVVPGMQTGLEGMDTVLDGVGPGEVCIVAARPGRGKTVLGLQFAIKAAENGNKALILSLEMGAHELGRRLMASLSNIFQNKIKTKSLNDFEHRAVIKSVERLGEMDLTIIDSAATVSKISMAVRGMKAKGGLDLVVIDYLGLIDRQQSKNKSTNDEISAITRGIKRLARETDTAIVLLAQLNREGNEKPTLHHLRDSGSIEQDADKVIFIYPKEKGDVDRQQATPLMWMDLQKNRQGDTGRVLVRFNKPVARFEMVRQGEEDG